jgi:uncharacterized membrane protein
MKLIDAQVRLIDSRVRRVDAETHDRRLVLVFAFFVLILATVLAFVAVITGHPAGAAIGGTGLLAIIGALFQGIHSRSNGKKGEDK